MRQLIAEYLQCTRTDLFCMCSALAVTMPASMMSRTWVSHAVSAMALSHSASAHSGSIDSAWTFLKLSRTA